MSSPRPRKNILVTGPPGIGKTTLICNLLPRLGQFALTGFYTEEIREEGRRVGFRAVALNGSSAVFAHRSFHPQEKHRVGRYGVKVEVLDRMVVPHLDPVRKRAHLVIVDEIAKMELLSPLFREKLEEVLDSPCPVLGTVALKGSGLIKRVKKRPDVRLFTLTPKNRNVLLEEVYRSLLGVLV